MNPYKRNQVPYAPMYYPTVPPQVKMEPARSPAAYEPWPWDGSYGYQYPVQCHGCCNHSCFPGNFMMRPPYPHVPPPYSHGYTAAPGAYPVPYLLPHYTMGLPQYEYNKDMRREHHCCGCPNHPHIQKEGKSVKIEEEEPDLVEMKGNQSVVPYEFKNYPYPIVWLPPGYMKTQEKRRSDDSELQGWDRSLHGAKAHENSKSFEEQPTTWNGWFPFGSNNLGLLKQGEDHKRSQHNQDAKACENSKFFEEKPTAWNGWFPFDANNLGLLKQGEDHKRSQDNQDAKARENSKSFEDQPPARNGWFPLDANKLQLLKQGEDHKKSQHNQDDKQSSFPFPIFWMPYKPEVTEREEPKEISSKQGPPSHVESTPVKLYDTEARQEGDIKDEGTKLADKNTVQKTIPVKQVEQNEEKNTSENTGEKAGGKKSPEDSAKRQSSSPQKSSKLPPVCLRIDPLLKKKSSIGNSRSPSPPGDKGKPHVSSGKQSAPTMSSILKENAKQDEWAADSKADRSKEVEENKSKLKSIEVSEGTTIQEGGGKLESAPVHSSKDEKTTTQMQKNSSEGDRDKAGSDVKEKRYEEYLEPNKATAEVRSSDARDISEAKETVANDAKKSSRMKLSETEAAVVIQSAFRGFEVRKREPLKKLKQLAKIKEQMGEIKKRIEALESSSNTNSYDKERAIITEMIMSLLLKLDTIQGVHPSIRKIRKSVAKELVSLQETLDLLIGKNLKECVEQLSSTSMEENTSEEIRGDVGTERQNQEDDNGLKCSLLTTEPETEYLSAGSCQNQPLHVTDVVSNSKDVEISDSVTANGNPGEEIRKLSGIGSETGLQPAMEIGVEDKEEEIANSSVIEAPHDCEGELKQTFESQQVEGETTSAVKTTEPTLTDEIKDVRELAELPQGTLGGYNDSEAPSEHEKIEQRDDEVSENEPTRDISIVPENNEVKDLNKAELLQEEGQKEQVISNPEDKLGGEEQEISVMEVLGEVLPELHEIPVQVQGKDNGRDAPAEFPKAETEAGPEKATETSEAARADSNECSRPTNEVEVSNVEEPAKALKLEEPTAAKVLGELSVVNNEMQDKSHDHGVSNANSLLASEATEVAPTASEALVELSKEHNAEDERNYSVEGLEEEDIGAVAGDSEVIGPHIVSVADRREKSDREESVPASARAVEEEDIESMTRNNEKATQPCGYEEPVWIEFMDGNAKQGDEGKQGEEDDLSLPSPTASQVSHVSDTLTESDRRQIEENEKLREMMEKLIEAGNKRLNTISSLSGRIKDLEKRLSRKKKLKIKRSRMPASGSSCLKTKNDSLEERAVGLAM